MESNVQDHQQPLIPSGPPENDRGGFDHLFEDSGKEQREQDFDPKAWAEQKQAKRQELYDTVEELADRALADPDTLREYLDMQARLGKASVANTLLTMVQMPEASYVMSFEDWQQKGRSVFKGEKGIWHLAANGEYERPDGTLATSFDARTVFDVSQTHGKPVRKRIMPPIRSALKALTTDTPVPIRLSDDVPRGVVALYHAEDNTVHVTHGSGGKELFFDLSRELARAEGDRDTFLSDCAANIVCLRYGLPARYCARIPDEYATLETREKRGALNLVREAACSIIERVDRNLYLELQQARNEPQR